MSHVNDEPDIQCGGIKTLLSVPGIGCVFSDIKESIITKNKPFTDNHSIYKRDTDYLIELSSTSVTKDRLYIDTYIWSLLHDYLFLYKTIHTICKKHNIDTTVKKLWNHNTTVYPPNYLLYVNHMITLDERLLLVDRDGHKNNKELDAICSYVHYLVRYYKEIPSRKKINQSVQFLTTDDLDHIVDEWLLWLKKKLNKQKVTNDKNALDALSDIVFLEYKKLSTDKTESEYIRYLKKKYSKQLDRPEHKLYRIISMTKQLSIPYPTSKLIERIL
jgi:hypothetical protein